MKNAWNLFSKLLSCVIPLLPHTINVWLLGRLTFFKDNIIICGRIKIRNRNNNKRIHQCDTVLLCFVLWSTFSSVTGTDQLVLRKYLGWYLDCFAKYFEQTPGVSMRCPLADPCPHRQIYYLLILKSQAHAPVSQGHVGFDEWSVAICTTVHYLSAI